MSSLVTIPNLPDGDTLRLPCDPPSPARCGLGLDAPIPELLREPLPPMIEVSLARVQALAVLAE